LRALRYDRPMSGTRRSTVRAVLARTRDGLPIRIRLVRDEDARHADAFFGWLSAETRYLRFMHPVNELTPQILEDVLAQDGLKRVALVAELVQPTGAEPTPAVAIGRYAPTADPIACEVAITVGDSWQGRGVGRALLARLITLARRAGYREMRATALTSNSRMIALARAFRFDIQFIPGGDTAMRLSLGGDGPPRAAQPARTRGVS
jgi:acetyltransferase